MNYFAHGRLYVNDPYFLAGTATPDWLNIIDRQVRVRSKSAKQFVDCEDPQLAAFARGVVQHHHDDNWFHQTRAFAELNLKFSIEIRRVLPKDDGFRPSFLGHILVEILLDAELIAVAPQQLEAYYQAIASLDAVVVGQAVNRISQKQTDRVEPLIPRFCSERFLVDYSDDEKLLWRLNQVMRRVKLAELPQELCQFFPSAREAVRQRSDELLAGESDYSSRLAC